MSMHILDDFPRGWMQEGAELETVGTELTAETCFSFLKLKKQAKKKKTTYH